MNELLEKKIIEACIKSGFKPRQHGYDGRFIESRDKYRAFHILSNRKFWIYLCDRYLHKKENRILIKKVGKYGQVVNGIKVFDRSVDSIEFFKKILKVMKPYGIRKKDDACCPGHSKYGERGLTAKGIKRPRNKKRDKPRKAKERKKKIEDE